MPAKQTIVPVKRTIVERSVTETVHPVMQRAYRAADYVQWQYFRHAAGVVAVIMAAACSTTMRLIVKATWITLKITWKLLLITCMIGFGILFTFLSFAMGSGKLAKTLSGD